VRFFRVRNVIGPSTPLRRHRATPRELRNLSG
jgi:hypothetical protein